jgi:Fe(3+) dicitrate transport protein
MDYENQIVQASVAGGIGATLTNAGETLHQGVETSVRLDSSRLLGSGRNVYVRAAFTYLPIARYEGTRFSSIPGFTTVPIRGNRLPYAPEYLTTLGVGYAFRDALDVMIEGVHVGRQFGDDLNTVEGSPDGQRGELPAHLTWNASANYQLPVFNAGLFVTVKNVTDRLYIADRSRGLLPGMPRLIQAGLKLRF